MIQRQWATIDPIFNVTDRYLACNNPGVPPPSYIPIRAGENITAVYWYWLHPIGPMTVWLARCEQSTTTTTSTPGDGGNMKEKWQDIDCASADVNQVRWFKIWEAGLLDGPNMAEGMWYQKAFQRWDNSPALWPVKIPGNLRSGLYMVRHEILSLHVAKKPQFYPECAHLNVTGGGEVTVPENYLVKFPGVYAVDGEC